MTDWTKYKRCPICKAEPGQPCEHLLFATTKGKPVFLDKPHDKRKERK